MSLSINCRNTVNIVKVPFPPSISVDEIVQIHLKKGIKNVNKTMNAFMIYRKEYNNLVAKLKPLSKNVSKFVSISWKNEPEDVKDHYRQMAKHVKKCFKKKFPSLCFINQNQVDSTNDNHVPLGTVNSSLLNTNQNFLSPPNMYQTHLDATYFNFNLPTSNTDQNVDYPFNIEQQIVSKNVHAYLTMDEDEFMNHLSEDMALTYKTIIQSLPF